MNGGTSLYYAWFSAEACRLFGYVVYTDREGKEVVCTCVTDNIKDGEHYLWKDKVFKGVVTKWVRTVKTVLAEAGGSLKVE